MVVPKPLRSQLVRSLHAAHAGITKTLLHARSKYFWPHMTNDIRTVIDACEACQEHRQGLPFVPSVERKAASPMEAVSVDLMEVRGVKYLVMVDRFSSYPVVKTLRSATTAAVVNILTGWFREFGWPKAIGSDGGPQFRDEFKAFCDSKCIVHELSSTRNPQSNGLAESGVKRVKYLIEKTRTAEEFQGALAAYSNTPMADGRDPPAVAFHRREMRDPDLPAYTPDASPPATEKKEENEETKKRTFKREEEVWIYDPDKRRWSDTGVIARPRSGHESYFVRKKGGRMVLKNQRHLRRRLGRQPPV
jgi:transposase InsO family protein